MQIGRKKYIQDPNQKFFFKKSKFGNIQSVSLYCRVLTKCPSMYSCRLYL